MCRHCARLVEHPEDKDILHAFMERTALRVSERLGEIVTADQIDIDIHVNLPPVEAPMEWRMAATRILNEMHK